MAGGTRGVALRPAWILAVDSTSARSTLSSSAPGGGDELSLSDMIQVACQQLERHSGCVSSESNAVRARNVNSTEPTRIASPSASWIGAETNSVPRKVPFLLTNASSTAPSFVTTSRACRRETVD